MNITVTNDKEEATMRAEDFAEGFYEWLAPSHHEPYSRMSADNLLTFINIFFDKTQDWLMEKIDIEKLQGNLPFGCLGELTPYEDIEIIAQKVNEIIDFLDKTLNHD